MKTNLTIILVMFTCFSFGQVSLQSNGEIPPEIHESSTIKYKKKVKIFLDSSIKESRTVRLAQLKFIEQSTFLVDAIKNNGNIYINDSYTKLINEIADELLQESPDIRSNIHLYAYKAPYVNAFSTDQGDIFFTIGLLAHLDNEAELAFVVGHEIIHYIKQHNQAGFNKKIKVEKDRNNYEGLSIDESWEEIHAFSRSLEQEADILSLSYFLKTEYDTSAIFTALEKLKTAHLGYSDTYFNFKFLLNDRLNIPPSFMSDTMEQEESINNNPATHPEVETRISYCRSEINGRNSQGKKLFIKSSAQDFSSLKQQARKEQLLLLFDKHYYAKAIYNAYIQRSTNMEERDWYDNFINLSFNSITEIRQISSDLPEKQAEYSGELYKLWHFLYKSEKSDLLVINFIKSYYDTQEDSSKYNKNHLNHLITLMVKKKSYILDKIKSSSSDTSDLDSLKTDIVFQELKKIIDSEYFIGKFGIFGSANILNISNSKKNPIKTDTGFQIQNIKHLVIFNPYYLRIDERKDGYVDYATSYKNETKLLKSISDVLEYKQVNHTILDVRSLEQEDGDKFDDISTLSGYINRFFIYDLEPRKEVLSASEEKLDSFRKKYDTNYVMWIGARSYRGLTQHKQATTLLTSFIFPQYLPYGLLETLVKNHEFQLFYILIDLKEHQIIRKKFIECQEAQDSLNLMTVYLNELLEN
ncbi:MAG: hypothetical protein COA58_12340 [Bacteroidetes bacterium]|nr:MAG: hypothetical protein COA58_12340 [Bacteroidota bacterium]